MTVGTYTNIQHRIQKLGISCKEPPDLHRIAPPIAALACFPMHMVAAASAVTDTPADDERSWKSLFDLGGVREALVIGEQESELAVADHDVRVLHGLLTFRRPSDRIVYDYAFDTLHEYFELANPDVVETLKMLVARSIVAVSEAAGEGWFGSGNAPSDEQQSCIEAICKHLELRESPTARVILAETCGELS